MELSDQDKKSVTEYLNHAGSTVANYSYEKYQEVLGTSILRFLVKYGRGE